MKNKKDGGRIAEELICFGSVSRTFSGNFLRAVYPSRVQVKLKRKQTNKQKVVIVFLGLKDFDGFKGRREMSRFQVVPFTISANFGFNLSVKVYASENPYKNGEFLFGF